MAAWKKWWVFFLFLVQVIIAGSVIVLWAFQDAHWARTALDWLFTAPGQITMVVLAGYLILVALVTIGVAVFRPTTTKKMTIVRNGSYRVNLDQAAVEKGLRMSLAPYEIYNTDAKVKMHRNSHRADVTVTGMLSERTNPVFLQSNIRHTVRNDLKSKFNIDLQKLKLDLKPYNHKQKVEIL